MGSDKGRLPLAGVAAATRSALLLEMLFEEVLLVGGEPPADAPGRRVVDPSGPRCALRGLVGALMATEVERVLVLAVDLPLVTADLLLGLVAWPEAEVVAPRVDGRLQPLCAVYRREPTLVVARERLGSDRLALMGLLDALEVSSLEGEDLAVLDPEGEQLLNANTPTDWARAEAHLKGR